MYNDIECPLIIQAAIGGDIEIFKYLMENGFGNNLKNITGHIGLTKKQKNSLISNVIGAAAYHGKFKLLEYIMNNYSKKVDLSYLSLERKCRLSKYGSINNCEKAVN